MRADRLVATLLLLQARGRVTAAQVAAELEVSERTARRDLDAIGVAGIPVYACRGRRGGWELLGGARTDLTGLTTAEVRTLFAVAGMSAPASPELRAALRKLSQALPEPLRPGARAAAASVVLDRSGWGRSTGVPEYLGALQSATIDGEQVRLGYRRRDKTSSNRIVHPLGLAAKRGIWYLVADTDEGRRTFSVDRVTSVERTGQPATRPDDFDLGAAWEQVVETVEELRAPARVEAIAQAGVIDLLRSVFGKQARSGQVRPDGRVEVTLSGASVELVARRLAAFGASVEVTGPPAARAILAAVGRELVAAYALAGGTFSRRNL